MALLPLLVRRAINLPLVFNEKESGSTSFRAAIRSPQLFQARAEQVSA
jgi:hypothetical protein